MGLIFFNFDISIFSSHFTLYVGSIVIATLAEILPDRVQGN